MVGCGGDFPCLTFGFVGIVAEEVGLAPVEVHADIGIERLPVAVFHAGDVDSLHLAEFLLLFGGEFPAEQPFGDKEFGGGGLRIVLGRCVALRLCGGCLLLLFQFLVAVPVQSVEVVVEFFFGYVVLHVGVELAFPLRVHALYQYFAAFGELAVLLRGKGDTLDLHRDKDVVHRNGDEVVGQFVQ